MMPPTPCIQPVVTTAIPLSLHIGWPPGCGRSGTGVHRQGGNFSCHWDGNVAVSRIMYERRIKRLFDIILSASALVLFAWLVLVIALAIKMDDPGPVFFVQKRVGEGNKLFKLYKFRSMKMCTPHDVPTHLLASPEQYITRVGRFLRKSSLDELPQLWNILLGHMSFVGPRPALWNQDDLVAERERCGANAVRPGLTGWAQVNGRDELEIPAKARLDGDYVAALRQGGIRAFAMDLRCLAKTLASVTRSAGVVEGGTGELRRQASESMGK